MNHTYFRHNIISERTMRKPRKLTEMEQMKANRTEPKVEEDRTVIMQNKAWIYMEAVENSTGD